YQNPAVPSNFAMTMRKYLEGALVKEVSQIENDRIIKLTFSTLDELGDPLELVMMVEIMARHSNVTLVNAKTGKIIDAIKHVGSDVNRVRLLLPGATFIMPPKQKRFNPYLPNQIYSDLARDLKNDSAQLAKELQQSYQGLSPETAKEMAAELLASDNLPSAYQSFLRHFENPAPVLITNEKNKTSFAAFAPINTAGLVLQSFATLSELLDAYYVNKAQSDRTKELAGQVLKVVHNELKKDQRKMKKFQKELADAADADRYRIRGELLTTWLHQVPRGAKSVELPNFYDENKPLKITLQPDLSPSRNAQKYFTRYNKLKASVKYVNEQMAITQKEIDYFETILSQI
ncbi:NFACT family protein, partial [Limosilactobacillus mucosae]|nr:NFACT family protein [Limosilactobacillus mucosae]